jgi:glycoside/pentoside/hexuronide:cation symporter, GPH family
VPISNEPSAARTLDATSTMVPPTRPEDRVATLQKIALGVGEIPSIGRQSIEQLALPIYNIVLGVNPLLITLALSVVRFLDAIINPIAGSLSDNTRTRWGRRRPYLIGGALVCGSILPLVWMIPPGWSETGYFIYFFVTLAIYFTAYAFFDVPLMAVALEATPDYHERTSVQAYKSFFVHGMGILSYWLFAITQLKSFDGTMDGARVVGLAMGATILIAGLFPALVVREGYGVLATRKRGLPFLQGVRATLTNRPFLLLCLVALGKSLPINMVQALGVYVIVYHIYAGDTAAGAILSGLWGTVYQITTIAALPVITAMAKRFGKIRTMYFCLFTLLLGSASKWFTFDPRWPYLVLVSAALLGPGQTAFYTLIRSMLADVCDYDELQTGLRREGMYGSMQAWLDKAVGSVATILSGAILVVIGFDQASGGAQAADTVLGMRISFSLIPILGVVGSLLVLRAFPLTAERMMAIRRELEIRRGVVNAGTASEKSKP